MTAIDHVVVAIPARDEQQRLPAALDAVRIAAESCAVPVLVVVAADACHDATERVAAESGARVVISTAGRVGGARRAAVAAGLMAVPAEPGRVWIANTDADSVVPADWLAVHLEHAERGVALLRGAVRPDPAELSAEHLTRWLALHPPVDLHDRVHGANLGVRGDAYLAAGGFPDLPLQEDVALVQAVEERGLPTASSGRAPVTTSARLVGRVEGGFATYLRERAANPARARPARPH